MTIRHMSTRLDALEKRDLPGAAVRWHWIVGNVGETHEDALAQYEREQGPLGPTEDAVIWRVIEPAMEMEAG